MAHLSPKEVIKKSEEAAYNKVNIVIRRLFVLSLLAGAYISIGGTISIFAGYGFPEITATNPALQRILSGAVFPLGLILIFFVGAELFTGNNAVLIPAYLNGKYSIAKLLKNWGVVYCGNFVGIFLFTYFLVYLTQTLHAVPWHTAAIGIAEAKVSMDWIVVFLKGIGANWMVCLAIWIAFCSESTTGKILGIWFPIFGFVILGYEHCIANMYFGLIGIWEGANISFLDFVIKNLIPSTLGNIIGGAFFVGTIYWYTFGKEGNIDKTPQFPTKD